MPEAIETPGRQRRMLSGVSLRALRERIHGWRGLANRMRGIIKGGFRPDLPEADRLRLRRQLLEATRQGGGELSAKARALELGIAYLDLSKTGRIEFLRILADDFAVAPDALTHAMLAFQNAVTRKDQCRAELALREVSVAPRVRFFKLLHALPDGFAFLLSMRADLLPLAGREPEFELLDADLKGLLSAWFDVGLLDLAPITWGSPAVLLEKLINYEAVHTIRSWNDLKRRLNAPDRRCFGFFHNKLPGEPLIFVEVALTQGLASNIRSLLDEHAAEVDPAEADTAIFYSISSTQKGLAGINFGNFLIKQILELLSGKLHQIKTFATLSPLPGFRHWLKSDFTDADAAILPVGEAEMLCKTAGRKTPKDSLQGLLAADWRNDEHAVAALREPLVRLAAHYLLNVRRKGQAYDPVANFHFRNGASLERVNWMADASENGIAQSAGIMANYLYGMKEIDANHEQYAGQGVPSASRAVRRLLKTVSG